MSAAAAATEVCEVTLEEDERTGHVYASYVPRKAGTHAVRILVGNSEIAGSPFVGCFTAGALTPSRCVARGDGLKRATVGRGALIEVSAHDSSGNAISHGDGSCFEVTMRTAFGHSIECTSRCLDRDDGSYRLIQPFVLEMMQLLLIHILVVVYFQSKLNGIMRVVLFRINRK